MFRLAEHDQVVFLDLFVQKRLTTIHIMVGEVSLPVFGGNLWLGYICAHQWMLYGAERCPLVGGLKRLRSIVKSLGGKWYVCCREVVCFSEGLLLDCIRRHGFLLRTESHQARQWRHTASCSPTFNWSLCIYHLSTHMRKDIRPLLLYHTASDRKASSWERG